MYESFFVFYFVRSMLWLLFSYATKGPRLCLNAQEFSNRYCILIFLLSQRTQHFIVEQRQATNDQNLKNGYNAYIAFCLRFLDSGTWLARKYK